MIEQWLKCWCPRCGKPNWVCNGDPNDLTVADVDGVRCHSCGREWLAFMDEDDLEEFEDYEPNFETGLKKPPA